MASTKGCTCREHESLVSLQRRDKVSPPQGTGRATPCAANQAEVENGQVGSVGATPNLHSLCQKLCFPLCSWKSGADKQNNTRQRDSLIHQWSNRVPGQSGCLMFLMVLCFAAAKPFLRKMEEGKCFLLALPGLGVTSVWHNGVSRSCTMTWPSLWQDTPVHMEPLLLLRHLLFTPGHKFQQLQGSSLSSMYLGISIPAG